LLQVNLVKLLGMTFASSRPVTALAVFIVLVAKFVVR